MERLAIAGVVVAAALTGGGVGASAHNASGAPERVGIEMGERVRVSGFMAEDELRLDYRGTARHGDGTAGVVVIERVRP